MSFWYNADRKQARHKCSKTNLGQYLFHIGITFQIIKSLKIKHKKKRHRSSAYN